jgi:CRP/FNR family transcriptional regulator, cyclic AMP receptor protein
MLDQKIELIESLPIFTGLSRKQLGLIVSVSTKAYFQSGENLITKDAPGHTGYLIMTGSARCFHFAGGPEFGGPIGPGALVGELGMLVETVHCLTVQAKERVRAIAVHREALRRAMERDPAIAQQISENLLARLRDFARDLRKFDNLLANSERNSEPRFSAAFRPAPPAPRLPRVASG